MKISKYERVEVTFSKNNEVEKDLFKYLEEKAKVIGKGTYLKQLLYEHMLKDRILYEDTSPMVVEKLHKHKTSSEIAYHTIHEDRAVYRVYNSADKDPEAFVEKKLNEYEINPKGVDK